MADLLKLTTVSLRASWHRMTGRICFLCKRSERARRHFEQVLQIKGDDFVAYFYLARLAYGANDVLGYRRELAHAERTSPKKMAKIRYLFDYFEPRPEGDSILDDSNEMSSWRARRMSSVGSNPALGERGLGSCPGGDMRRYGDDFSSPQERERFSILPPISPDDVADVDLDRLSESL